MKKFLSKKVLIIIGSILLVFVIGGFVAVNYLDNYLKEQILTTINENKESPYQIDISEVRISLLPTKVSIEKIKIRTDSLLAVQKTKPQATVDVEKITLKGASIWKYLSDGEWHADKVLLQNPFIDIKYIADSVQGISRAADTVANFVVAPLSVGSLEIINLTGNYQYNSNATIKLKKLDLEIKDARWLKPPTFRFSAEKIRVAFENLNHTTSSFSQTVDKLEGNLNLVSFDTSHVDVLRFSDANLLINNYALAHQNGTNFIIEETNYKNEIVKVKNVELSQDLDEKREIKAERLEAHHLDWQALQRNIIKVDKILVHEPDISILKDRNRHPEPAAKKMPYEWGVGLAIDTLQIEKGNIVYSERAEGLDGIGSLTFDSLNMMALSFHNFKESKPTTIKADMYFMKESRIDVAMETPLNSDTFEGKLKGSCSQIAIPSLNKMISPLTRFEANKGVIQQARFEAEINDGLAKGTFYITYEDLQVSWLKKDSNKKRKFLSSLLNSAIKDNVEAKEGKIDYHREYNDSLLRFVWRTIRSGLITSLLP